MKGIISNFCMGVHTQHCNKLVIQPEGLKTRQEAEKLVGKKVVWKNPEGKQKKEIKGEIRSAHGNSGAIRVLFETGMPGQSLGTEVEILA